ncbi:MAG: sigma-70 family RNA polymerase sigma factor [Solirubrobacteraceae bacterium]
MGSAEATHSRGQQSTVVAAAQAGDESAFTALVEPHRRELQVHCYRMLGSLDDSEDLVQETLLRAWRKRATFQGRSSFRAWLYRIATNACLDALARRPRPLPTAEVPWLQPYPDTLLEGIAPSEDEPDAMLVARETIELAFMVAIQHLPPRPRAVLILRDVLDWSARDTAELLESSVASVNSALQRARAALKQHLPERRLEWAPGSDPSTEELALLQRYMDASDRGDADAVAALLRDDARFSMPPQPGLYVGREAIMAFWAEGGFGSEELGRFRCVPTSANLQPAVACYLRRPGDSEYRALALDVLRIEGGAVAEIITFDSNVFPAFGLPATL